MSETVTATEREVGLSFADWLRLSTRLSLSVCPNCKAEIGEGMCCMTYTEWRCWGCGAHLDSRVVNPLTVYACETEWPEYERQTFELKHPAECACEGRGWFTYDEHPTLRHGYVRASDG